MVFALDTLSGRPLHGQDVDELTSDRLVKVLCRQGRTCRTPGKNLQTAENCHFPPSQTCEDDEFYPQKPGIGCGKTLWINCAQPSRAALLLGFRGLFWSVPDYAASRAFRRWSSTTASLCSVSRAPYSRVSFPLRAKARSCCTASGLASSSAL